MFESSSKKRVLRIDYNEIGAFSGVFREGVWVGGGGAEVEKLWRSRFGGKVSQILTKCLIAVI